MNESALQRFMAKYRVEGTGCWLWTAYIDPNGYGRFGLDAVSRPAHRVAYEHWKGIVPGGLQLDHLCRVRACVNPDHLEPVTAAENLRRGVGFAGVHVRKTHCPQGHPYEDDNCVRDIYGGHEHRVCRTCKNARQFLYNRRTRGIQDHEPIRPV